MRVQKKVVARLNKCYSVGEVVHEGRRCLVVASDQPDPCLLLDEDGTVLEHVWEGPGGVMTLEAVPDTEDQLLGTHRFYGPDDSAAASIVSAVRGEGGSWTVRTLCDAPFVHRFGTLERAGVRYLLVCCLKTGHDHAGDWSHPGACYAAPYPKDVTAFDAGSPFQLELVMGGLLKNHGFCKTRVGDHDAAIIGCEQGTFLLEPPEEPGGEWEVAKLLDVPSSDSVLVDFDGDGRLELGCMSPFHGNSLTIWHLDEDGRYVPQWKYPASEATTEMLHATWPCIIQGRPTWIVGWRHGSQETIAIRWDEEAGTYAWDVLDTGVGCANALHFVNARGEDVILAANRETDEVALYTVVG